MTYKQPNSDRFATIGGRIKAARQARGLTTEQVAEQLDVSRPTITTWETGRVKNPPEKKIKLFAKVAEVSLAWLMHREGEPPSMQTKITSLPLPEPELASTAIAAATPAAIAVNGHGSQIAEIKAGHQPHATGLDLTPQAQWVIPREVLTLGFNCDPDQAVIRRVLVAVTFPDGTTAHRGDYILIDASRNVINEPGLYYIADPDGREVKHVTIKEENGGLVVANGGDVTPDTIVTAVLGRAMAVFRAL